jgi:hypothetical protein
MELRQELLAIYMDNHNYDKIINICENFGRVVFKIYNIRKIISGSKH